MPGPAWKEIPVAEEGFAPDKPAYTPGILTATTNLYPTAKGVRTLPTPTTQAAAEGSAIQARGLFAGLMSDGVWRVFKATNSHIWRAQSPFTSWTEWDNSQTYTMSGGFWSFAGHGTDVYATDTTDAVQKSTGGGQFAALTATAGSVPKASFVVVVEPGGTSFFVMLLGLATNPQAWAASGVGNDGDWGFDIATLGASGTLGQSPGAITGAANVRSGVAAFKSSSLYYGQFTGTPYVWTFQLVSDQVGTVAPQSIIQLGDVIAWIGPDNFYAFDGYSLNPIPNPLRSWFFDNVDRPNMSLCWGRYDPFRDIVVWHFPINGGGGVVTDWIAWARKTQRWTWGKTSIWAAYPNVVPTDASGGTAPALIDTSGNLTVFPAVATTGTTATLTTWEIGDDDVLLAVHGLKPHWSVFPTGAISLSSVVKTTSGTAGSAGSTAAALDARKQLDLIQAAQWQTLTLSFAGDGEVDALGVLFEFAGKQ